MDRREALYIRAHQRMLDEEHYYIPHDILRGYLDVLYERRQALKGVDWYWLSQRIADIKDRTNRRTGQ